MTRKPLSTLSGRFFLPAVANAANVHRARLSVKPWASAVKTALLNCTKHSANSSNSSPNNTTVNEPCGLTEPGTGPASACWSITSASNANGGCWTLLIWSGIAYQLLNHPDHAHWIQYKLDQRIDHLLIDEFQDTNPTQWRLILPLLEEMAAGGERPRSLFLVGDAKQSIYRFRRGNPQLLGVAAQWMQQHLQAGSIHLDHSWRSSPAVMEFVNQVFQHPDIERLLPDFQTHTTHRGTVGTRGTLATDRNAKRVAMRLNTTACATRCNNHARHG